MTWNDVGDDWPPTIEGWDDCIKAAGLHIKWSPQLREIHDLWVAKLPRIELALMMEQVSSNLKIKYNADGTFEPIDRTQERLDNIADCERKIKRGKAVMRLCKEEERIRLALEVKGQVFDTPKQYKRDGLRLDVSKEVALTLPETITRSPIGTTYYIDADSGSDGNAGTSTGAAWATLAKYTSVTARSAGDIAILRRSMTATYNTSDTPLNFDEDGTLSDKIYVKADNANAFGDDVDLSVTATATLTFGSKTVTYSSDISGVLAAGDWIYEVNDDADLYAYEVTSVSTVTVTLLLPYKGMNDGSGKTTTNLGTNAIYGTTTDTGSSLNMGFDKYWVIRGLTVKSNTSTIFTSSRAIASLEDCVFEIGTTTGNTFDFNDNDVITMRKSRILNSRRCFNSDEGGAVKAYDCLFDGNSKTDAEVAFIWGDTASFFDECEFKGNARDLNFALDAASGIRTRNCVTDSTLFTLATSGKNGYYYSEDFDGTIGDTRVFTSNDGANDDVIMQSEVTTVRSGGSTISIKVIPTTQLDEIVLLDIPIYASTSAKTYTVYVKSNATANWTADPTAAELELSFSAWGHATNNFRKANLSTDVADFNGVTTWEALAVTVTPAQAGLGYLRLKYRKPKEASVSNEFYVDPLVVIS